MALTGLLLLFLIKWNLLTALLRILFQMWSVVTWQCGTVNWHSRQEVCRITYRRDRLGGGRVSQLSASKRPVFSFSFGHFSSTAFQLLLVLNVLVELETVTEVKSYGDNYESGAFLSHYHIHKDSASKLLHLETGVISSRLLNYCKQSAWYLENSVSLFCPFSIRSYNTE